jgi:uncharacterized tellurite resistance protein B-like protein
VLDAIRAFVVRRIAPAPVAASPEAPAVPERDRVQVAACALLLEVAHADEEFSPAERRHIEAALERHFGLDPATRGELIALADAERRRSVDHFQFTRLINQHYDLGQKMVLAEVMWGIILADGTVAKHESYLVRKLANLLDLEPAYLAQARRAAAGESAD